MFARRQGYVDQDPAAAVKLPKSRDALAERVLSEGELIRIIYLEESERNRFIIRFNILPRALKPFNGV